jgi:glycine cleavage system H protein
LQIEGYESPDELYYDEWLGWARIEGDVATVGVTDFAQKIAGEIVYVEVPRVGRAVEQGQPFMSMESGKWVGRIKAVVGGEIVEANEELDFSPEIIHEDPYGAGWLAKIRVSNRGELDNLFRASDEKYQKLIAEEKKKYEVD